LEIAMHDVPRVQVDERLADAARDVERALGRERLLRLEQRAEARAFDELHRDVHPALLVRLDELDDGRVIEAEAEVLLAHEALVEDHVALELHVRHLERNALAGVRVLRAVHGGHPAPCEELGDLVLVESITYDDLTHDSPSGTTSRRP